MLVTVVFISSRRWYFMLEMDSAIDEIKKNLFKELKEVNRGGGGGMQ